MRITPDCKIVEPLPFFKQIHTMAQAMRYRILGSTGMKLSIVSLGGSGYGKNYGPYNEKEAIKTLEYSLDRGVNYIDTAYWYGQGHSEKFIGRALSGIPRDKYFIATKAGRYELDYPNMFDFDPERFTKSAEGSLKRLNLDYVDLLQIHDIEFSPSLDIIINETLPAVEKLRQRGLCRYIGITGYPIETLKEVIKRSPIKIDSVLSYCRLSLFDNSLIKDFGFFQSMGVPLINACPVGMGLLTKQGTLDWHPALPEMKEACRKAVEYCTKQGVDVTRLALNYSTRFEECTTTLVSMYDTSILESNLDAVLRPLTEQDEQVVDHLEKAFFAPLPQRHWEGVELKAYWDTINNKR